MQTILLIVSVGSSVQVPHVAAQHMGGYHIPLLTGEAPESRALQLCSELRLQPEALTRAGSLHIYSLPKRRYGHSHVDWQALEKQSPSQKVTLFHASTPATRSRVDIRMLCESVPYAALRPMTQHWLPFVLLGEGVHVHLAEAPNGALHSTKIQPVAVTSIELRNPVLQIL